MRLWGKRLMVLVFVCVFDGWTPEKGCSGPEDYVIDFFSSQASAQGIPHGWEPLAFKKIPHQTKYILSHDEDNYFVQAVSSASASGLLKKCALQLTDYPVLSWKWKVNRVIDQADIRSKKGDDCAARVYVAFQFVPEKAGWLERIKYAVAKKKQGGYPPHSAITYVWDNRCAQGTSLTSPYNKRTKIIVCETGDQKIGQWVSEKRHVYQDYLRLFHQEPPPVLFVAIMCDTDNTQEQAQAWFDDIVFVKEKR